MARRPTIIDVAREAGVSESTESLVIQDSRAVREETRAEVRRAMARRGYVCNRSAAKLRGSNVGLLSGLLQPGHRVGRDARVVGFDDIEEWATAFPPLSSVRCDIAGVGRQTAATMPDWLEGGQRPVGQGRAPMSLVARASSPGA